ncbi:MAG TPA: HD domain-containing phosphohydrolase [Dehalococcoidia bacterium]|nr:HD domain-containing phosphohydrolase [Dehalococcoidia bacterium]
MSIMRWLGGALLAPARDIRLRVIAPYAALTVLLAAAGSYLVTDIVTGSLQDRFNNQLVEAGRVASDAIVRVEQKHLETVRGVAFTQGVGQRLQAGDATGLEAIVRPLAANQRAELVQVLDASGRRVYGTQLVPGSDLRYAPISDGDLPASWPIVRDVLASKTDPRGDKFASLVNTSAGWALYTAGPIYNGDRLAGVVLVGSPIASVLVDAKTQALADVTLYDFHGAPLASTFAIQGTPDQAQVRPAEGMLGPAGVSTPVRLRTELFGRRYDLLFGNLQVRGQTVGVYSVGLPSSFIFSASLVTRGQIGALFIVATLAVLLLGWLIGRSITRPLLKLADTARAVARGDLGARSSVFGHDQIAEFAGAFDAMTARLQRQHLATIRALTSAIDARDPYTMGHSLRVGQLAVEIGRELGLDEALVQHLEIGGYLHDIGKIGVRDDILLKPGALTPAEREAIELHPAIGRGILAPVDLPPEVVEFVAGHHEKLDGGGYPGHLHAERLGIIPRIASVADIYDALTTDRPYRRALSVAQAIAILRDETARGQLDPRVAAALERVIPRWESRRRDEPALAAPAARYIPSEAEREAA